MNVITTKKAKLRLLVITSVLPVYMTVSADTVFYGQFNLSFDVLNAKGEPTQNKLSSNTSTIGFKGIKPLNNGNKFIYKGEWGIDTGGDSNDTLSFSKRNQILGFIGKHGAMALGRYDSPFKTVGEKADLFWHSQLGQNRNVTNPTKWDLRPKNTIVYQTPRKNGFQASFAYAKNTDTPDNNDDLTVFAANTFYKKGAYRFGVGLETHKYDSIDSENAVRLMASYKKEKVKIVSFYQDENNSNEPDARVIGLGAAYAVGAGVVKGQIYNRDIKAQPDVSLIAIGYDHRLAKKTDVYAQVARINGGGTLGGSGHGETITSKSGGDAEGFSIGVRHRF